MPIHKDFWHINGADYDFTGFIDKHPGGPVAIGLGRGIDCTRLLMQYHVPNSKAYMIMKNYRIHSGEELDSNVLKCERFTESAFHADLCEMVREHFKGKGNGAHKATYCHIALVAVFLVMVFASWWAWFAGCWISLVSLPVCSWLLGVNTSHDGSHFAFSTKWWINHAITFTSLPFTYNPYTWYSQHVVEHHTHCNSVAHDVDLFHFAPFRLHKDDTRKSSLFHMAKVVLVGVHLAVGIPFNVLTGLLDKYDPDGFVNGTHIKLHEVFRRSIWHYSAMWSTFVWVLSAILLSFFVHDTLLKKCCFMAIPFSLASLLFIIFTQVSHIQEICQSNEALNMSDFFKAQVLTSLDYSCDSKFWSIISGGLNVQSLHHCLPWVASCHYTALYPKFLAICLKHDNPPPMASNLCLALNSCVNHVVKLNT